ncbi:SH3 9 and RhoGEF and SH3 2 and BAR and SH3 1 doma in containing protein [Trichuris trichiura]|uniref:SH3 9 and RhoGEF and SH3 2 and BAR and SH3 1 doma in containing protein n=1 Tax=Trichuris trichiura TaxID=36087 RepID=A0A077Z581_TRITR|nr:SH3 9 and RhoGEF and SH3 2 and BAR and SH3 1 doma in containing protein [Trichuris trichiura]
MLAVGVARALYDFHSSTAGDLQFNSGDVILIKRKVNNDWFEGESLDGRRRGIFPVNYVLEEKLPKLSPNDCLLIAVNNFDAQTPADLSIHIGDVIVGKTRVDTNWWRGELYNKRGLFPAHYVQPLIVAKESQRIVVPFQAIVKTSLKAQLPEEIDLNEGDVVIVEQLLDDLWCRGVVQGRRGTFPLAFVQPIQCPLVGDGTLLPKAYGITKYKFVAKCSGELSFEAGQKLTLIGHVDDEWTLCKIDDKAGIAPTSYISIKVDCPKLTKSELQSAIATVSRESSCSQGSHAGSTEGPIADQSYVGRIMRVAYDFCSGTVGDLTALTDDYVRVTKVLNDSWVEAVNLKNQRTGIIPVSYLASLVTKESHEPTIHWRSGSAAPMDNGQLDKAIARTMLSLEIDSKSSRLSSNSDSRLSSPTSLNSTSYSVSQSGAKAVPPPRPSTLPTVSDELNSSRRLSMEMNQLATVDCAAITAISELLHSEREYHNELTSLKRVCEIHKEQLDLAQLIVRLGTLVDLSSTLVGKLEQTQNQPNLALFGQTFYDMSYQLSQAYIAYCNAQEECLPRLLQAIISIKRICVAAAVEALLSDLRSSCQCFDLTTTLVRPIQRFLKYPLYLVGLLKIADAASETHLKSALCRLSSASKLLNENKRRSDLVKKYREECERSFADRLSKFNVHSMRKKSSRLGVRLSSTFGLTQLRTNEQFDQCVNLFNDDVSKINAFSQHVQSTIGTAMSTLNAHRAMVEALDDSSTVGSQMSSRSANVLRNLSCSSVVVQELTSNVRLHVTEPTSRLQGSARILAKLIDKRRDKLLDWEVATNKFQKATKNGDYVKLTALSEQMKNAQAAYDALNEQLIVDLASFHTMVMNGLEAARAALIQDMNQFTVWLAEQLQSVGSNDQRSDDGCIPKPIENFSYESPLISFEEVTPRFIQLSSSLSSSSVFDSSSVGSAFTNGKENVLENKTLGFSHSAVEEMTSGRDVGHQQPKMTATLSGGVEDDVDEFCVVAYDFQASGPDELSVLEDDLVVVHDRRDLRGNADWWLVESEVGDFGYVPATYLKPYTVM